MHTGHPSQLNQFLSKAGIENKPYMVYHRNVGISVAN